MPDFFTVTVSQVTRRLSMIVKGDKALSDVYVAGEISNFTLHKASGHMYFTLKDEICSQAKPQDLHLCRTAVRA